MKSLTKLPITQYSGLDYSNIIKDVYNLVQENPDYNENWDDFLSSSSGRMMIELFAYIADQLATRIDWTVNENYLTTATQKSSIIKLLKLIDYQLELPNCATLPIKISLNKSTNKEIIFTPAYTELSGIRNNIYTISGKDKLGTIRNFEAIGYDSENSKFLYKNKISLNSNTSSYNSLFYLNFYEGTTKIEKITSTTLDNFKITLNNYPVINNSPIVFIKRTTNNILGEIELLKVENFLQNEAQSSETEIPYVVNSLEDGKAQIEFAPTLLMSDSSKLLPIGSELFIFYRVGGGTVGNLSIKSINFDRTVYNSDNQAINASLVNEETGYGGTDAETIEHAVLNGPLSLRSVKKAVTIEDYASLLSKNQLVLKSISYGSNNMPSNFYDKYGLYINPQEVWNFILLNKNYEGIPPSKYNNYKWMNSKLENRFNEKYSFKNSKFNEYCYYYTTIGESLFSNYKDGSSKTFKNYIIIMTPSDFKTSLGSINDAGDFVINEDIKIKSTKSETSSLYFDSITDYFIDNSPTTLGMVNGSLVDTVSENTNAMFYSPVYVENSNTDSNNVYGFDISSKYCIGVDIDGRGMIIINLKDDYASDVNKKIYLSNPSPLTKPASGVYYNPLYEARYHKGIVEKINYALSTNTTLYGDDARPSQLLGLSIPDDTSQAPAFDGVGEITIPLAINGIIYNISYGGTGRTSQYYKDIATYINTDLSGSGFICEFVSLIDGTYDIKFTSLIENTISVSKSGDYMDMLYYLYNDLTQTPPSASNGGDYSNVASMITDSSGRKYIKLTSPTTGISSSIQFKVSDFSNNLNNSIEFMDKLGVSYIGNTSFKITGVKSLTLVSNYSNSNFGNFIYETNILGRSPFENKYMYVHYTGKDVENIVVGSTFTNFYSDDEETYKEVNKAHYVYNTILDDITKLPIMDKTNLNIAFTNAPITSNSLWNAETISNKVYIYPYDFIKLKTLDLSVIAQNPNYFTSTDVLKFSIDNGNLITVQLETITTKLSFITALSNAFTSAGYSSYLEYIEYDYDNPDIIYIKNKERNPNGNIYFPSVADDNLFFQKIFGTPSENELKTIYREGITQHPLEENYVEITNHPYIDSDYSPQDGIYDEIRFDSRIIDLSYEGEYRTPDFYYSFDETDRVFVMNKVNGNRIPDTEFYIHFINDKRYNEAGELITTSYEDDEIKKYLDRYKISSIENKILSAVFQTFDIEATINYKSLYSLDSLKLNVENALRTAFNLESMNFAEEITKSKIYSIIQSIPGVVYSEITYLGTDYTDSSTAVLNKLDTNFDTISILSEDIYNESKNKIHGLIFTYNQVNT